MDASSRGAILKYHPGMLEVLTLVRNPDRDMLAGSLTVLLRSNEEYEGALRPVGNRSHKARLTARDTSSRYESSLSDPVVLYGRAIAQRIKGTPRITG